MVPRVGVEPTRPYGQRILRTLQRISRSRTKRYEPVFTRLAVVKVSLRLATYRHVRPPSWPHLQTTVGRMWVTPNDGPGVTFSFSIPCVVDGQRTPRSSLG